MRQRFLFILLTILTAFLLAAGIGFFVLIEDLPRIPEDLRNLVYSQPTEIYAADGSLVHRLGGKSYVPLAQISRNFQHALLAAEDGEFYAHHGVDKIAMMRAVVFSLMGRRLQSGSTLTQQLVKNLFFSFQRLWSRKLREILISLQIESTFTKEQILEAYCNLVWFGGTAYGIEDAAQQFFGKSAGDLTIPEAAMLAGIVNSPIYLNPYSHYENALARQRLVLRRMKSKGFLDEAAYHLAVTDSLRLTGRPAYGNDFVDYVISEAEKKYGHEAVYYGGLKIYTTMDPQLQAMAEEVVAQGVAQLEAALDSTGAPLQGAIAAISVPTGEVRALVGARKYVPGGFNRAVNSNRHVGSGIKPFVYYAALENLGMTPVSVVNDTTVTFRLPTRQRWSPRNFDRRHRGRLTLKSALMQSINVVSAQLTDQLTPKRVVETCQRFGVSSLDPRKDAVLSLALGSAGISPLEMAAAYAVFANNGVYFKPITIKRVEDLNGVILDRAYVFGDTRFDPKLVYQVLNMMQGVIESGTARVIRAMGFDAPAAGKTGTSTEFTDAWFTGFTTALSVSAWVGYDRDYQMYTRQPRRGVDGARGGAPIWTAFMKRAQTFYPPHEFEMPAGLKIWYVDPRTGLQVPDPQFGIPVALPDTMVPSMAPVWERLEAAPKSDSSETG
ncbi:MAG: PBP1A family penicillin-binding protein [candidate division KSB1 bacterium]|nr:PBP1A family penicillin-binding protein [candidate division KSB1 bacterium]MDZ7365132.1 PBP1A family penicillin-binding protein [candidate division KSB1 bacterium]MDZ7404342.1 PBP1A family penicillin-binding protein [candidate division KSB1 bacterium]